MSFSTGGRSQEKVERLGAGMTRNEVDAMLVLLGEGPHLGEGPALSDAAKESLLKKAFVKLLRVPVRPPVNRLSAWEDQLERALDPSFAPPDSPLLRPAIYGRYRRCVADILKAGKYIVKKLERIARKEHATLLPEEESPPSTSPP